MTFFLLGVLLGAAVATAVWLALRGRLLSDRARLQAEVDAAQRAAEDQKTSLTQLRDTFAALSQDALRDNRQEFLEHADGLLKPVRETLAKVQTQLAETDTRREGSFQAVSSQLRSLVTAQEQLRQAAEGLSRSLRSPNVRGKWGEIQLRRIVEMAGMLGECDFVEKETVTSEGGGRQTPDLIVKLPGEGSIVVDSKVPIDAYLEAVNAKDDAQRRTLLASHAKQVRDHVRALGSKEYWKQFHPTPEFVVMFLPLEPLLSAAFEQDGSLLEFSATLGVIPATPMTLLAILRAVAFGWQQQRLAKNAEEIQQLGRDLYDRLATMVEHLEGLGANLKQAALSYDRFVGSLEQKVLPGARRFKELGVSSTKELEIPDPLHLSLRRVTREELTGAAPEETANAPAAEPAMPLLGTDEP